MSLGSHSFCDFRTVKSMNNPHMRMRCATCTTPVAYAFSVCNGQSLIELLLIELLLLTAHGRVSGRIRQYNKAIQVFPSFLQPKLRECLSQRLYKVHARKQPSAIKAPCPHYMLVGLQKTRKNLNGFIILPYSSGETPMGGQNGLGRKLGDGRQPGKGGR